MLSAVASCVHIQCTLREQSAYVRMASSNQHAHIHAASICADSETNARRYNEMERHILPASRQRHQSRCASHVAPECVVSRAPGVGATTANMTSSKSATSATKWWAALLLCRRCEQQYTCCHDCQQRDRPQSESRCSICAERSTKTCGRCRAVEYCSRQCQQIGRRWHRDTCNAGCTQAE